MADLILHHYEMSPFSEKVRLIFGLKGLPWRSVIAPAVMPKPDLAPLTGGYRRIPVLQIGADIYCDTNLIAAELERRHPEPSLYPQGGTGLSAVLTAWSETQLFWPIARYVAALNADELGIDFFADRAAMRGQPAPPDLAPVKASASRNLPALRPMIAWVEDMLSDGRSFLLGEQAGLADFGVYHALWFLNALPRKSQELLAPYERLMAWMLRISEIGHGAPTEMAAAEALQAAKAAEPEKPTDSEPMDGLAPGDRVAIGPDDYARDMVAGQITRITADTISIARRDDLVGDVVVHFPRLGYQVRTT